MSDFRRRRWFVDRHVQGALLLRVAGYWLYCLLAVTLLNCLWVVLSIRPSSSAELFRLVWTQSGPSLIATLLLLPVAMMDSIRFSNRFVGPLLRIRREVAKLAAGEPCESVHFRDGDYWQDLGENFNRVAARTTAVYSDEGVANLVLCEVDDDECNLIAQ